MATFAEEPLPYTAPSVVNRKGSQSTIDEEKAAKSGAAPATAASADEQAEHQSPAAPTFYQRFRPWILAGIAAVIIGWWISATVLPATRHRWCVTFAS